MAGGESESRVEESVEIVESSKRIDGVEFSIAATEGLPTSYSGVSKDKAEAYAALSVDAYEATTRIVADKSGRPPSYVLMCGDNDQAIGLSRVGELVIMTSGSEKAVTHYLKISRFRLGGGKVRCRECGLDVTLEAYECPSCGKRVPFLSPSCPFCDARLDKKECPSCGGLINVGSESPIKVRDEARSEQKAARLRIPGSFNMLLLTIPMLFGASAGYVLGVVEGSGLGLLALNLAILAGGGISILLGQVLKAKRSNSEA